MDLIKIGKFIAMQRKQNQLTQAQLAEKLNITDRAISKWETGKALPDSSIMLELCEILGITVNDLLNGEVITMDHYNKEMESKLLELVRQKQQADKRLLAAEVVIGITAAFVQMETWLRITLVVLGFALFLAGCFYALRFEQTAGFYWCKECGNKYVPTYKATTMAPHMGRTRYMKCPQCGKKSWQTKVLTKE